MRQSSRPLSSRRVPSADATVAVAKRKQKTYQDQTDCACFVSGQKPVPLCYNRKDGLCTAQRKHRPLYLDDCDDPDCQELDRDLQKSLDHFTDYEHYERCCDEGGRHHHHCSHGAVVEDGECCEEGIRDDCTARDDASMSIDCASCFDNCEACVAEHVDCYEEVDVCEEDCQQCEDECEERGHERDDCPQNHPTTRDNCLDSCSVPLPLLGPTDDFDLHTFANVVPEMTPCTDVCQLPTQPFQPIPNYGLESAFDTAMDHWQTFVQGHHCAPDPCLVGQISQFATPQHVDPAFGFGFGCDPTNPANRYPWQNHQPHCTFPISNTHSPMAMSEAQTPQSLHHDLSPPTSSMSSTTSITLAASEPAQNKSPDRTCEWVMPCGSICGASFPRTEDLKKHVKNSHGVKGTVACGWRNCSAAFATEAALTGHISKKHLAFDEEGPWKCTFPNCTKTFMYKQVRDEHVASHNGGNKMHCPICHQWLNAEGSNFRRHMASHGPKNEHMKCKYEYLGCKKRFPRIDNLRRHETCCKFGKKAQGVHHHHHKVHVH